MTYIPSAGFGFSTKDESLAPALWRGVFGVWAPFWGKQGQKVFDWSGFKNHGTLKNMTNGNWMPGAYGLGVWMNGINDYIDFGNMPELNGVGGLTMSVRVTTDPTGSIPIFSKFNDNFHRFHLWIISGALYWNASNGASHAYGTSSFSNSGSTVFTMRFDGSGATNADRLKGFINAEEQTLSFTGTIPTTTTSLANPLFVGRQDIFYGDQTFEWMIAHNYALPIPLIKKLHGNFFDMFRSLNTKMPVGMPIATPTGGWNHINKIRPGVAEGLRFGLR